MISFEIILYNGYVFYKQSTKALTISIIVIIITCINKNNNDSSLKDYPTQEIFFGLHFSMYTTKKIIPLKLIKYNTTTICS
jgi:hypothetical protein